MKNLRMKRSKIKNLRIKKSENEKFETNYDLVSWTPFDIIIWSIQLFQKRLSESIVDTGTERNFGRV